MSESPTTTPTPGSAAQDAVSLDNDARHDALVSAHFARLDALLANNLDTLSQVVGEDLIFVSPTGATQTRPEVFAAAKAGRLRIERMDSSDISTRFYGDVGMLMYQADGKMRDGDTVIEGMTRSTTVYVWRDVRWQLVSQHQSRMA